MDQDHRLDDHDFAAEHRWWLAGVAGATIGAVWNHAASSFLTWQER